MFHDIFSHGKEKEDIKIKIRIDNREKNSLVPSELIKIGFQVEWKQLEVGDYIIYDTIIERKTISDFKASIPSRRI
jgi:ERCC4-type nuclease